MVVLIEINNRPNNNALPIALVVLHVVRLLQGSELCQLVLSS